MSDMESSVSVFTGAFYIFVIMTVVGVLMAYAGGAIFIDRLYQGMDLAGVIQSPKLSHEWNEAQLMWRWFANLYYALCACLPILGLIIWASSIVKRTSGSRYQEYGGYR